MKQYLFGYRIQRGKCWNEAKQTYRGRMEHCLYHNRPFRRGVRAMSI